MGGVRSKQCVRISDRIGWFLFIKKVCEDRRRKIAAKKSSILDRSAPSAELVHLRTTLDHVHILEMHLLLGDG